MKHPSAYSSLLYLAGVIAIACVWAFVASALGNHICASDESNVVCLREWISTGGSLAALIVSMAAALFAFGQYKAAEQQANAAEIQAVHAALPKLDRDLAIATRMYALIGQYRVGIGTIAEGLKDVHSVIETGGSDVELYTRSYRVLKGYESTIKSIEEIDKLLYNEIVEKDTISLANKVKEHHFKSLIDMMFILTPIMRFSKVDIDPLETMQETVFVNPAKIVRKTEGIQTAAESLSTCFDTAEKYHLSAALFKDHAAQEREDLLRSVKTE